MHVIRASHHEDSSSNFINHSSILSPPLPYIGERKREGCPKSKPVILRGFGPLG